MKGANPDIVAAWVRGWALSREVPPPVPAYGGLRVDVGQPDQMARYVFAELCEGLTQASCDIQQSHVLLKVCAAPEVVLPLLASGWQVSPPSFFMTLDKFSPTAVVTPEGYSVALIRAAAGFVANCRTTGGDLAASGRLALAGPVAVFDRIETHPGHRRLGLGRAVMATLEAQARRSGAEIGALVATPDGKALYGAMGWRLHALYTTAVRD